MSKEKVSLKREVVKSRWIQNFDKGLFTFDKGLIYVDFSSSNDCQTLKCFALQQLYGKADTALLFWA